MPDFKTQADTLIEGVINRAWSCEGNKPFKLMVETVNGDLPIIAWPNKFGERAGELPKAIAKINTQTESIAGLQVKAYVRSLPDKGYGPQYELKDNDANNKAYSFQLINNGVGTQPPAPVPQVGTVAGPVARLDKKLVPQPTDRDTLIVDQVLFKGAVDLLKSDDQTVGMSADDTVALVIRLWEGVRARHNPKPQPEQEAPADGSNDIDDGESFGVIQLGG